MTITDLKSFIADLARPFAIYVSSASASICVVILSCKIVDQSYVAAAALVAAVYAGVGALYGAKAWEVAKQGKHAADVEIAKSNTGVSP